MCELSSIHLLACQSQPASRSVNSGGIVACINVARTVRLSVMQGLPWTHKDTRTVTGLHLACTCAFDGSFVAGMAVDCRYARNSSPHRDCSSFSVAATSFRKELVAASRTSSLPCKCVRKHLYASLAHSEP